MQSILLYEEVEMMKLSMRIDPFLPKPRGVVKMACLAFRVRLWPEGLTLFQHIWWLSVCSLERSPPGKLLEGSCQLLVGGRRRWAAPCSYIANTDT